MTKINLILLGQSGVGKTTILFRFKTGEFQEVTAVTHGVEFHVKKIYFEGKEISLFVWDTSGQEKFNAVLRSYYRQADGVLLVYDVTDPTSFLTLSKWLCDIKDMNDTAEILIAGNKNEDPARKKVAVTMVRNFARQENLEYTEMSAMSGDNVEETFLYLTRKVLIAKEIITDSSTPLGSISLLNNVEDTETNNLTVLDENDHIRLEQNVSSNANKNKGSSCC